MILGGASRGAVRETGAFHQYVSSHRQSRPCRTDMLRLREAPGRHRATMANEVDYPVVFERDTESASSICTVAALWRRYSPSELAVPRISSNREDMKLALGGSAAW